MRRGNTISPEQLPDTSGLTLEYPVALRAELESAVLMHFLALGPVCFFTAYVAACLRWPAVTQTMLIVGAAAAAVTFPLRFVTHYAAVCTCLLHPAKREEHREVTKFVSVVAFVLVPLTTPVLLVVALTNLENLRQAWVSFLAYDCSGVPNPGVLRNPGGSRPARVLHFWAAVLLSSVALGTQTPVGGWTFQPLWFLPPVCVVLLASLLLSTNISDLSEFRDAD